MQKFGRVESTPSLDSKLVSTNHLIQPARLESMICWNQLGVDAWRRLHYPKLLHKIWANVPICVFLPSVGGKSTHFHPYPCKSKSPIPSLLPEKNMIKWLVWHAPRGLWSGLRRLLANSAISACCVPACLPICVGGCDGLVSLYPHKSWSAAVYSGVQAWRIWWEVRWLFMRGLCHFVLAVWHNEEYSFELFVVVSNTFSV